MANRSYQTVKLFGNPEKIKEVFNYILSEKKTEFYDDNFGTDVFPISLTAIYPDKNEIVLETKYGPADFFELSKRFPEVGFKSSSFTDGVGNEEVTYALSGSVLYSVFIDIEGPYWWKNTTGNEMKSVNDIVEHYLKIDEENLREF